MRIVVIGAGIAGLTSAVLLSRAGHEVIVLEKGSAARPSGYMIDFFGPGFDVAERMNLLGELAKVHYPVGCLRFVDDRGNVDAELEYASMRARLFADRHFNFMRGDLERVLLDHADGVEIVYGVSPRAIVWSDTRVAVDRSDGVHESADLLIGADGVHSTVRATAMSSDAHVVDLRCHTAAFVVPGTVPGVGADAFTTLADAGITVGAYPIRDERTATFFVHRASSAIVDRSAAACREELEAVYRGRGTMVDALLDAFPRHTEYFMDDVLQIAVDRWSVGPIALVGDACGAVSLLAGQGASMAMAGAWALAQEVSRTPGDLEGALTRYEKRVRPEVIARQHSGRRAARWFLPGSRWSAAVRSKVTAMALASPVAGAIGRALGGRPFALD